MIEKEKETIERNEFLQIRQQYIDASVRSSNLFDNTMITLISGSIGGSFLLITKGSVDVITYNHMIILFRLFAGLSLALIIISFRLSEIANRQSIDLRDNKYRGDEEGFVKLSCKIQCNNQVISMIKPLSILFFFIGIIQLTLYIYTNIMTNNQYENISNISQTYGEKSIPFPPTNPTSQTVSNQGQQTQQETVNKGAPSAPIPPAVKK